MINKVSDFLENDADPYILGCFYSRILEFEYKKKKFIYTYTDFRKSKIGNNKIFDLEKYISDNLINDMNTVSHPSSWKSYEVLKSKDVKIYKRKAYYILENDIDISVKSFFDKLYFKILSSNFVLQETLTDLKKDFIRGFLEIRGSIDKSGNYLTNDLYFNSNVEATKARILIERMNVPVSILNLNFRELQAQYLEGKERKTQLRINIHWFAKEIGFVNKYKAYLYSIAFNNQTSYVDKHITYFKETNVPENDNLNLNFSKYLDIYFSNVLGKKLKNHEIEKLRKELGFVSDPRTSVARNQTITTIKQNLSPDICEACGLTTTSQNKKTGRQNFVIHHFISYQNDPSALDNIDNLVKLCSNCHDGLKKGRSTKEEQIKMCDYIIRHNEPLLDFCKAYFNTDNINDIVSTVQKMLL